MSIGVWLRTPPGGFPPDLTIGVRRGLSFLKSRIPSIMKDTEKILGDYTPVDTGEMKRNISSWNLRMIADGGFGFQYGWRKADFPAIFYPLFVLGGTGIYGPYKTPIVPQTYPALVWLTKEGETVVAKQTKGQKPQKIFENAFPEIWKNLNKEIQMALVAGAQTMKGGRR